MVGTSVLTVGTFGGEWHSLPGRRGQRIGLVCAAVALLVLAGNGWTARFATSARSTSSRSAASVSARREGTRVAHGGTRPSDAMAGRAVERATHVPVPV